MDYYVSGTLCVIQMIDISSRLYGIYVLTHVLIYPIYMYCISYIHLLIHVLIHVLIHISIHVLIHVLIRVLIHVLIHLSIHALIYVVINLVDYMKYMNLFLSLLQRIHKTMCKVIENNLK